MLTQPHCERSHTSTRRKGTLMQFHYDRSHLLTRSKGELTHLPSDRGHLIAVRTKGVQVQHPSDRGNMTIRTKGVVIQPPFDSGNNTTLTKSSGLETEMLRSPALHWTCCQTRTTTRTGAIGGHASWGKGETGIGSVGNAGCREPRLLIVGRQASRMRHPLQSSRLDTAHTRLGKCLPRRGTSSLARR